MENLTISKEQIEVRLREVADRLPTGALVRYWTTPDPTIRRPAYYVDTKIVSRPFFHRGQIMVYLDALMFPRPVAALTVHGGGAT